MNIHQSMTCRIRRFAAQRNRTWRVLPEALVTGPNPVSASNAAAVGNRSQSSPISAISPAATTGPIPVNERKIGASGRYQPSDQLVAPRLRAWRRTGKPTLKQNQNHNQPTLSGLQGAQTKATV
jgi:hypothetical protein